MRVLLALLLAAAAGTTALAAPPTATPPDAPKAVSPPTDAYKECLALWDAGTHMTRQEWARTCKRVQTRLDSVRMDALTAPVKGSRSKTRTSEQ